MLLPLLLLFVLLLLILLVVVVVGCQAMAHHPRWRRSRREVGGVLSTGVVLVLLMRVAVVGKCVVGGMWVVGAHTAWRACLAVKPLSVRVCMWMGAHRTADTGAAVCGGNGTVATAHVARC